MGIFGALTTAVAGMRSQSFALENISGNIANSQTTAFKRIDTSFVDLIPDAQPSRQLAGSVVSNARMTNSVQGDIQSSSISTFMAINGDGFFAVQKPSTFTDNRPVFDGIDRYTRRGDFQPDKNGFLVNGAGYYLMGIPVDATTGNLVGSVPQLLQFQNDFLPAQVTTQIEYRANLAAYPRTAEADPDIPKSELLNPATFSANPIASAPTAAKITGVGAQLTSITASVTGTGTFADPAVTPLGVGNGGTLRITATPAGGVATNYDIALADGATLNSIVAAINGTAGLGPAGAVVASIDTTGGTNKLRLAATSADVDFEINPFSTDALTTRLGLAEVAHASTNLMDRGVADGETLDVTVGSNNFSVTFGTGPGEISTLAELTIALGGYPPAMGTVTLDASGNLTFTAVATLVGGTPELPFFVDGSAPYTGAVRPGGTQALGFAGRIAVNASLEADVSRLVVFQTAPQTPAGDPTRPNFLYDRLSNAKLSFSPQSGVGSVSTPFNGVAAHIHSAGDQPAGRGRGSRGKSQAGPGRRVQHPAAAVQQQRRRQYRSGNGKSAQPSECLRRQCARAGDGERNARIAAEYVRTIMSISGIGSKSALGVQPLIDMRRQAGRSAAPARHRQEGRHLCRHWARPRPRSGITQPPRRA